MFTKTTLFLSCLFISNCYSNEDINLVPEITYSLNSKTDVNKIKNTVYNFISPNIKVGDRLEHRKMCSKVEWSKESFNGNKEVIRYTCYLTKYNKLFVDFINNFKQENKDIEYPEFKIPNEIEQNILFDVSKPTPTPIYCSFKYKSDTEEYKTILHPYCFKLGYDSEYTESWNDIVSSSIFN